MQYQPIRRRPGRLRRLGVSCLVVVTALTGVLATVKPAAAAAGSYMIPCETYDPPDFGFMQFVSGWGYHVAEDVCHQEGVPVFAASEGLVVYSARTPDSYRWGNLMIIEHPNTDGSRVVSLYGHMRDDRQVGAGTYVHKGQLLGYVGPRGPQNGYWDPHIHFGIHPGAYGAAVGSYAPWVHGYENNQAGWVAPGSWIRGRMAGFFGRPLSITGSGDLTFAGQSTISFKIRNNGHQTWFKDGNAARPVRLGTDAPRDRGSGFARGGPGWIGTNRIVMEADTPPTQTATFTARFDSPQVPGSYRECFNPVIEGQDWIPISDPLCLTMTVRPREYRAEFVSQQITTVSDPTNLGNQTTADFMRPGDRLNTKLLLKNVGELPWDVSGSNPMRLGTNRPRDRASGFTTIGNGSIPASENWLSANRASTIDGRYDSGSNSVVADSQITTGETAVFSMTITAPDAPGNYAEHFAPVVEGFGWLPDQGFYFPIRVLDRGFHYGYVSQSAVPPLDGTAASVPVTLQLRNTGREPWPVGGALRLGTENPRDHSSIFYTASGTGSWLGRNRPATVSRNVSVPGKTSIDGGEVAEFAFNLTPPPSNVPGGNYRLYVGAVLDGVAWLPENYGIYFPITMAAPYNYQVMKQTYSATPTNIPRNSNFTANIAIKNTGRTAWTVGGSNPTRLGTIRPTDRTSIFAKLSGADAWLSANRASSIDGRITNLETMASTPVTQINPGEIALFSLPINTNQTHAVMSNTSGW